MLAITWDPTGTHAEVRRAPGVAALTSEQIFIQPSDVYYGIPYSDWARYDGEVVDVLHLQYNVGARAQQAGQPDNPVLPPAHHPADLPWWHWRYVNVRGWTRLRQRSRVTIGLYAGVFFAIGKLAISWIEAAWTANAAPAGWGVFSDSQVWSNAIITAIIFAVLYPFVIWRTAERNYRGALSRRAEYDIAAGELER